MKYHPETLSYQLFTLTFFSIISLCLLPKCSGAPLTPAQTNGITLGIDATVCVLNHITEPPAQIAIDCGLAEIGDVTKVLAAHYAAELRENTPPLTDAGAQ